MIRSRSFHFLLFLVLPFLQTPDCGDLLGIDDIGLLLGTTSTGLTDEQGRLLSDLSESELKAFERREAERQAIAKGDVGYYDQQLREHPGSTHLMARKAALLTATGRTDEANNVLKEIKGLYSPGQDGPQAYHYARALADIRNGLLPGSPEYRTANTVYCEQARTWDRLRGTDRSELDMTGC
jgi:hypothetical protein